MPLLASHRVARATSRVPIWGTRPVTRAGMGDGLASSPPPRRGPVRRSDTSSCERAGLAPCGCHLLSIFALAQSTVNAPVHETGNNAQKRMHGATIECQYLGKESTFDRLAIDARGTRTPGSRVFCIACLRYHSFGQKKPAIRAGFLHGGMR